MEEQSVQSPARPVSGLNLNLVFLTSILFSLLAGVIIGYIIYPVLNPGANSVSDQSTALDSNSESAGQSRTDGTSAAPAADSGTPFCKEYGTYTVPKTELLEVYTVDAGDTLRSIAKSKLGDETRAVDLIGANPSLSGYEVDQVLPMRTKIYLPGDIYNEPDITAYMKSKGNISFNKDGKPMFGINAPNSGTGPFIITDKIKADLADIREGDCVVAVYGSRGFDPQKVVMEVKKQ